MQQYPDSPYYRMYTEQPPFPLPRMPLTPPPAPVDTSTPLTVYGNALSEQQLQRCSEKAPTRWLMPALAGLLLILSFSTIGIATMYGDLIQGAFIGAVLTAAWALALYGRVQNAECRKKAWRRRYRLYAAASDGGTTTVFYPDRVEQRSPRRREILVFSAATRFTEYEDILVLEDGKSRVVLRAEDLAPGLAQAVYERICMVVPFTRQFAVGRFYAKRSEPAPPPFPVEPAPIFDRVAGTYAPSTEKNGLLRWLLATCAIMASLFTALFYITPFFALDFLIFFAAMTIPSLAAAYLWRQRVVTRDVTLIFTGEGLVVNSGEREQFIAAADVYARRTDNGAKLFTPAGNFVFPWNATQHRQQLEWMLFGQR